MRRADFLFEAITRRDNLRLAAHKALAGKRAKPDARAFVANLEDNLRQLGEEIADGTVRLGEYHQFTIHDPKERLITAPCFRERVLHHAIMNLCEPVFERWLIADTFACRKGKGRIACVQRARHFAYQFPYYCQMDIRKYFPSIAHSVLKQRLQHCFQDDRLLYLFCRIIDSFPPTPSTSVRRDSLSSDEAPLTGAHADGVAVKRGLPIGSLTSQHFANFYLGWFDRFVKETLRVRGYVRYMDDFVLWGKSASELREQRSRCREFLSHELQLDLKSSASVRFSDVGVNFLGCRVYRTHTVLNDRSRHRFRKKLESMESAYLAGGITESELQQCATSMVAFTRAADVRSWRFRHDVLQTLPVSGQGPPTA